MEKLEDTSENKKSLEAFSKNFADYAAYILSFIDGSKIRNNEEPIYEQLMQLTKLGEKNHKVAGASVIGN